MAFALTAVGSGPTCLVSASSSVIRCARPYRRQRGLLDAQREDLGAQRLGRRVDGRPEVELRRSRPTPSSSGSAVVGTAGASANGALRTGGASAGSRVCTGGAGSLRVRGRLARDVDRAGGQLGERAQPQRGARPAAHAAAAPRSRSPAAISCRAARTRAGGSAMSIVSAASSTASAMSR